MSAWRKVSSRPTFLYWAVAVPLFAAIATRFGLQLFLDDPSRDLWQHLAALRALIEHPVSPENPFVPTGEFSRHYHPYWVGLALLARALGWTEWQAIDFAAYLSMGSLAVGIFLFGRVYFGTRWGPFALLLAMLFGWLIPTGHTGLHSLPAFFEGAAYPASLLIGLTLILWALVIRSLAWPRLTLTIVPLVAFMFATHQLGAGIALIGAACLVAGWPGAPVPKRALVAGAMLVGLAASCLWPYFNPFELIVKAGNPTWVGPPYFYSPIYFAALVTPSFVGLAGLVKPVMPDTRWPMLGALSIYTIAYLAGLSGIMIAARFLMPLVLVLQIGLAALAIRVFRARKLWPKALMAGGGWACIVVQLSMIVQFYVAKLPESRRNGNIYAQALLLTSDIPDHEAVAAYDVAVWPVVAAGQRAVSVPWPEPLISDLGGRQAVVERLFGPSLSRTERLVLARRWGVRTLIIDDRYALRREPSSYRIRTLSAQSVAMRRSGHMWRFDLEAPRQSVPPPAATLDQHSSR